MRISKVCIAIALLTFEWIGVHGFENGSFPVPVQAEVRNVAQNVAKNSVIILSIEGIINPLSARYLQRELSRANPEVTQAVILELNTPGGLESSMRDMTQALLNSKVPTVVYVAPQGARAASAGMFITIAAHCAAMAPGTNIGAAHPVSIGEGQDRQGDPVKTDKIVNDAAAFARSIAKERGRNQVWVEEAVRNSVSIAAHEAQEKKVIDLLATNLNELLRKLDQRTVSLSTGNVTLQTRDVQIIRKPMHFPEKILHVIADPNIAYLLITLGFIGIIAELYSPGLFFPGITGLISLLLGFTAVGSLPVSWAGLILLMLGMGLFFVEAQEPGLGVLGLIGLAAFILGSLMLYTPLVPVSPAFPAVQVSRWVIGGVALGLLVLILIVMKSVVEAKRRPVATGRAVLVGKIAVAVTDLSPKGTVKLDHERWSAVLEPESGTEPGFDSGSGIIRAGESVKVVGLEGAILKVKRSSAVRLEDQNRNQTEPPNKRGNKK